MTTVLSAALPSIDQRTCTIEDRWFAALDGCVVSIGDDANLLMVVGIHRGTDDDLWLQLAPHNDSDRDQLRADRGMILHCRASDSTADVLHALRAHLFAHGVRQGGRVEVVCR
jgi:hypothetical protein